ncbi:MAG: hypothetical protein ACI4I9_06185 [Porcipelethomonas sp.]
MIKGVNKKVLEINNPQSIYFEKAVFFLKPNMKNVPEKLMQREAHNFICSMSPKSSKYTSFMRVLMISVLSASAAAGAFCFIVQYFL